MDAEFGDFFTLECDDDIKDMMNLKFVLALNPASVENVVRSNNANDEPLAAADTDTTGPLSSSSSKKKSIVSEYVLPKFDTTSRCYWPKQTANITKPQN